MRAVIFEFWPAEGRRRDYFDLVAELTEELKKMPGLISVERFESLTEPGKLLSLQFWESDEAVANWRRHAEHRKAQGAGRAGIFRNYRLRVAEVDRDYGMTRREQAP